MSAQFDPRITAYFGDAVLQAGFMPLPHLFLRHYRTLGLTHVQAMFVLQLMEIAWDVGDPPNNVTRLAERMGVSARTIRQCSQEVHALGLVEIYDQFDESGAQVENGYDLSPLFRRLAELAPAPLPSGQIRARRSRPKMAPSAGNSAALPSPPLQDLAPLPLQDLASPPLQDAAVPPCSVLPSPPAQTSTPPLQHPAGLKEEDKNRLRKQTRNKQQHQTGGGGGGGAEGTDSAAGSPEGMPTKSVGGRSLRWGVSLDGDEITRSREILDRVGVNADVAEAIAPTLHPAESWALWCYARGARLGPAWVASQCYDFAMRRPRPAGLAHRYDEAGRLLVLLPPAEAELAIDIIDQYCPHCPEALYADQRLQDASPAQWSVVEAAWAVMAEQRGGQSRIAPRAAPPPPRGASSLDSSVWPAVQERLEQETAAADWHTWIEPLVLLDIDDDTAIVGAPNVFARDQVAAIYAGSLEEALTAELGRPVRVEVVIGTLVSV